MPRGAAAGSGSVRRRRSERRSLRPRCGHRDRGGGDVGPALHLLERALLCLQSCRGLSREPPASPLSAPGLTGLVYPSAGCRSGGAMGEAKPVLMLGVAELQGFSSLPV
ncbi:unnamed protein product [Coccothraustes coccothraustes]